MGNEEVLLQIWDTAGQERFQTLTSTYFNKAQGIILVYDTTDAQTKNNIANWIKQIENNVDPTLTSIALLANKVDIEDDRKVTQEEGSKLAEEFGL